MIYEEVIDLMWLHFFSLSLLMQLKDENGQLMGVDASGLLLANSGNDLPVSCQSLLIFLAGIRKVLGAIFSGD